METLNKKYRVANNHTLLSNSVATLNDQNLQKLNPALQNYTNQEIAKNDYEELKSVAIKDKAYAYKMGSKKSPERYDQESIPSEISEDMWGEIPKL